MEDQKIILQYEDENNKISNIHQRQNPLTAEQMDTKRKYQKEYEYLRYMAQARDWISRIINVEIVDNEEFKRLIQKGEIFIQLINNLIEYSNEEKNSDLNGNSIIKVFKSENLVYKHSDNHNLFLQILKNRFNLNPIYFYATIDAYNKNNIPSIIYCLHALILLCEKMNFCFFNEKNKEYIFSESELKGVKSEIPLFKQYSFSNIEKNDNFLENEQILKDSLLFLIKYKLNITNNLNENLNNNLKLKIKNLKSSFPNSLKQFLSIKTKQKLNKNFELVHKKNLRNICRIILQRKYFEIFSQKDFLYSQFSIISILKYSNFNIPFNLDSINGNDSLSIFNLKKILESQKQNLNFIFFIQSKYERLMNITSDNNSLNQKIREKLQIIELFLENKRIKQNLQIREKFHIFSKIENVFKRIKFEKKILKYFLKEFDSDFLHQFLAPLFDPEKDEELIRDHIKYLIFNDSESLSDFVTIKNKKNNQNNIDLASLFIICIFRNSQVCKELCKKLLINNSDSKSAFSDFLDKLENVNFPYYVTYYYHLKGINSDIRIDDSCNIHNESRSIKSEDENLTESDNFLFDHFFTNFIQPFILVPNAFLENIKFDKNINLFVHRRFKEIFKNEKFNFDQKLKKIFLMNLRPKIKFRIKNEKMSVNFQIKEINQFIEIVNKKNFKFFDCSGLEKYEYTDNRNVELILMSPFDSDQILENADKDDFKNNKKLFNKILNMIIDVLRVSDCDSSSFMEILQKKSSKNEEMKYLKLLNHRNKIIKSVLEEKSLFLSSEHEILNSLNAQKNKNEEVNLDSDEKSDSEKMENKIEEKNLSCELDNLKNYIFQIIQSNNQKNNNFMVLMNAVIFRILELQVMISQKSNLLKNSIILNKETKKENNFLNDRYENVLIYYKSILKDYKIKKKTLNVKKLKKEGAILNDIEKLKISMEYGDLNFEFESEKDNTSFKMEYLLEQKEKREIKIGKVVFATKRLIKLINDNMK